MVKINMMCGKRNFGNDWVHVDGADHKHTNGYTDTSIWAQFNNSIDLIYCSHGIAYFTDKEIKEHFKSWFNKLRPGGVLQIATPDWEVLRTLSQPLLGPVFGKMKFQEGSEFEYIYHRTIYTFESLYKLLSDAGFINIHRYDHTKTCHPNTGNRDDFYDDHSAAYYDGKLISLNVQCIKP